MKLILDNNQSDRFRAFYADIRTRSGDAMDHIGYRQLLFSFYEAQDQPIRVRCLQTGKDVQDYDGVYINGYLHVIELATATALACQYLQVSFVNKEFANAPSYSKLTGYVKLAAAGLPFPPTIAGSQAAILTADDTLTQPLFPAVLKRADADRGVDNYKVSSFEETKGLLADHDQNSIWILQQFVENDGYYVINFYNGEPAFGIYRTLEARPEAQKAHMYRPKGGSNATLLKVTDIPAVLLKAATASLAAMNRQIGSVDCLYDPNTEQVNILEVNFNPQLVTIETFKDVRAQAFIDNLRREW